MIGTCLHARCARRPAFTLIEVLLTLALLVIVSALAWPALERPFASMRLRKAADQVRAAWAMARVEAMDSGEIYLFRFTSERDRYRVERCSALASGESTALGNVLGESTQDAGNTGVARRPTEGSLPVDVTFVTSQTEPDTRAAMIASEAEQSTATGTGLSDPILFYPDGTTSTARLVLKNEHNRYIELLLRGLTGVISISEVRGSEESLR